MLIAKMIFFTTNSTIVQAPGREENKSSVVIWSEGRYMLWIYCVVNKLSSYVTSL